MSTAAGNWIIKEGGTHTEDAANKVVLSSELVGWPLDGVRTVRLQFDTLAGGSVTVEGWGPQDEWTELATGLAEDEVYEVSAPWPYLRCSFVTTGGAGRVSVQGIAVGW